MAGDEPGYVVEAKRLTALKLAASDDAETAGSDGARAKAETPKALRKRRVAATKRRQEHAASRIQRLFRAYLRGHVWGVAVRELLPPTLERVVLHSDSLHDRATTLRLHWDRNPLSRPVHRFRLQLWKERLQIWVDLLSDRALAAPSDLAHTAVVRDLQPGTAYYFRLRAYNSVMAEEAEAWVEGSFCTDRYVPPRSQPDPHREGKHRDVNRADIVATRRRRRAVDEAKTAEREQRLGTQRAEAAAAAEAAALAAAAVAAAARTAARSGAKHAAGADDDGGGGGDGGGDDAALATAAMRGAAGRGELSSPNTIEAYNAALMHYTVRAARGAGAEESGGGADTVTAGTGAGTGTATPTGANPAAGTGGSDAPYREEKPPPEPQPGDTTERSHCRESKATAVAAPWEIHQDGDGYMYYWNRETEESRWEPPADAAAQEATEQQQRWQRQQQQHQRKTQQQQQQAQGDGSSLDGNGGDGDDDDHLGDPSSPLGRDHGHGWREYTDPSTGHTYYHHAVSGESRWLSPFAAAAAAVGAGVAASKRVGRPQSAAPPKAWSTANPRRASEIRAEAAASKKQHGGGGVASPNSRKQAELQAARQLAKEYETEAVQADGDGNGVNGDGIDGDGDGGDGDGGDGDGDVNGDAGDDDGAEGDMPPDKSRSPYQPAASPSPWKSLEAATSKNSDDGQASRDSRATRSRRGSSKGKKQKKPTTVARRRSGSGGGSSSSSMRRSTAQRPPPPGERHPLDAAFGGLRMPAGWEERYDPQGRRYFYNRDSARTQHHFPVEQPRTRKDSWAPDSRAERERLAGSLGVDQDGGGGWVEDMLDEDVDWKGRRNYLAESKRASVAAPGRAGAGWHPSRGSGREGGGGGGGSGSSSRKYRKKTKKGRHIQQRRGGRPTATTAPGTTKKSVPVYSSAHGASQVLVSSSSPRHGSGGDRVPLGGGRRAGDGRQPAAPRMAKEHIQYSFHDVKAMLEVQREAMAGVLMQEQQRRRNRRQRQRSKTRAAAAASALNRQGRNGGVHHEGDGTGETKEQQQQQQPARPGHRRQESTGSVDSTGTAGSEISEGTARRFLQNVTEESLKRVSNAKIQLYQQLLVSRAQERVWATRTREREERPRPWRAPPPRAGPTGSEQSSGADDGSSSNSNNRTKQKKKKPKDRQLHGGRRRNDEHPPPQQEKEVPEVDEVGGAGGGGGDDAGSHRSHRPRTAGTGSRGTGAGTGAGAGAGGRAHRRPHTASGVGNAHGGAAAAAGARRPRTAMPPRRFLVELGAEYR